jgi:CBS domain-containing protein
LWVLDSEGRPVGWIDSEMLPRFKTVEEAMVHADPRQIALSESATLREALSRMLEQGFGNIPVIDEHNRFIGEVRLSDIEHETSKGGAAHA